jgi:hypothetical protein
VARTTVVNVDLQNTFSRFWHWLTTSRYVRLLEERLVCLEAENVHLRNAIYARAGVGPVPLGPAPPSQAAGEKRTPQPLRRPISWSQVKQKLEAAANGRGTSHSGVKTLESAGAVRRS